MMNELEKRLLKFIELAGTTNFARENNLDSVHRQLVLAYIEASKRFSGREYSQLLGRLSVFTFQILPINPKLVLSKQNKIPKVDIQDSESLSYKSLWALVNQLHDPLELFTYDSKQKVYKLLANAKDSKQFTEFKNVSILIAC